MRTANCYRYAPCSYIWWSNINLLKCVPAVYSIDIGVTCVPAVYRIDIGVTTVTLEVLAYDPTFEYSGR